MAFNRAYAGRRVLVTGHTGFKGSWLSLWLQGLGARVSGFGLPSTASPGLHEVFRDDVFEDQVYADIRDAHSISEAVHKAQPDFIFHLAAQPLVRLSYVQPAETFEVNVMGTVRLLEAVRAAGLRCPIIVATSDKCYENRGWEWGYRENDPLGGHDVYSMSKAATELVTKSWRSCFFKTNSGLGPLSTVRAGNVIGGEITLRIASCPTASGRWWPASPFRSEGHRPRAPGSMCSIASAVIFGLEPNSWNQLQRTNCRRLSTLDRMLAPTNP